MQTCPRCTLISPDGATHCDCGYDFRSAPSVVKAEIKAGEWKMARLVLGGLAMLGVAVALAVKALWFDWRLWVGGVIMILIALKGIARFRDTERAIRDEGAKREKRGFFRRR